MTVARRPAAFTGSAAFSRAVFACGTVNYGVSAVAASGRAPAGASAPPWADHRYNG